MQCSKCGLDNIHGAMYCEDCGTPLRAKEAPIVSIPPPRQPPVREPRYQAPPPPPPPQQYQEQIPFAQGRFAPPTMPVRPPALVCPRCRKENVSSAVYCGGCGISLTGKGGIATSSKCYGKLVPLGGGPEYYLDRDKMLIGRKSEGDQLFPEIDLGDVDNATGISRKHAVVVRDELHTFVEDLGSANGTFVNESKIEEGVQHPVHDGDTIRLGGYSMVLRLLK
ncbi:MAG: FHA domain-containing protein [Vulcanimicrobiota bacterium]